MDTPNADLDVDGRGNVRNEDVVASKTTPNLRHETKVDNSRTFECDFTHLYDDNGELPQSEKVRDETAVRTQAAQRGLVPIGPVKLTKVDKLPDGRNVRLVYSVPVELNGVECSVLPGAAVADQPDDTPADLPEKLNKGEATEARQPSTETHGEKEK